MYLINKYTAWYNSIIVNAQNRTSCASTYVENHHIVPRCFGGTDSSSNLVKLTAREHFICHTLLTKMTTGKDKSKMVLALTCMTRFKNNALRHQPTSRQYDSIRRLVSKTFSGPGNPMYGRTKPQEQIDREVATRKDNDKLRQKRVVSKATRLQISASRTGKSRPQHVINAMVAGKKLVGGYDNNTGKSWFNDGIKSYLKHQCPPGCVRGRLTLK